MEDSDEIKRKISKCCKRLSKEAQELYVGSSVTELDGGEPISALEFYRDRTPVLGCIACVNCVKNIVTFLSFIFTSNAIKKAYAEATWRQTSQRFSEGPPATGQQSTSGLMSTSGMSKVNN